MMSLALVFGTSSRRQLELAKIEVGFDQLNIGVSEPFRTLQNPSEPFRTLQNP